MDAAQSVADNPQDINSLSAENAVLREQVQSLKTQLDWFKRQLFGRNRPFRDVTDRDAGVVAVYFRVISLV